jgi:ubiquitin-activating enzyme E1
MFFYAFVRELRLPITSLILVSLFKIDGCQSTSPTSTTQRWQQPWGNMRYSATWNRESDRMEGFREPCAPSIGVCLDIRCGSTETTNDEERYSRQVYTLGARAHSLIRGATVYLDGPAQSGLLFECAKNLALSGIHHLIVLTSDGRDVDNFVEQNYHNPALDDLGLTYQRGARAEIFGEHAGNISDTDLLIEYLRRLNPNILVSKEERNTIRENSELHNVTNNAILLVVDRPHSTALKLNQIARQQKWAFVATETAGIYGKVFCDFGAEFVVYDTDGETPTDIPLDRIEALDNDNIVVYCVNGERHDVSKGDTIRFQYRNGEKSQEQCLVVDVQTPFRLVVKLVTDETSTVESFILKINQNAATVGRVKSSQTLTFDSLDTMTDLSKLDVTRFTPSDLEKSYDVSRRSTSMACFRALSDFVLSKQRLPTALDKDFFWSLTQNVLPFEKDDGNGKNHFNLFIRTCSAKFSPLQAVFGAISSQEVMKAITGLYYPVHQFLLYDCDEIVNTNAATAVGSSRSMLPGDAQGLRYILGDETVDKLQSKKIFVVGSGAIGCEILKNLASMGVGTKKDGKVIVTDMDTIEKSNLSRQLLFRDSDIGKFKSAAAHEAVVRLNPSIQMEVHSSKIGEVAVHNPFDEMFWSKGVDIVLNALDNVEARLCMDKQCVVHKKGLIDAGTMGPKGNVQVVVPYQSESYASSVDPPEASIPVCTLKNFPYAISHTIQWARDLFDGLFERRPSQANQFLNSLLSVDTDTLAIQFVQEKGDESAVEISDELKEDLSIETLSENVDLQVTRKKALLWALELAIKVFHIGPIELLEKHPIASFDEEGVPFWSGTRRSPKSLSVDLTSSDSEQASVNENYIEFVRNGARLRVKSILGEHCFLDDTLFAINEVEDAWSAYFSNFTNVTIDDGRNIRNTVGDVSAHTRVRLSLSEIVPRGRRMFPIEFEKDDECNGHVSFVNAASNLRAIVYGIVPVDAMETRRVAGKIVPAMISTTAFVSALSCAELVKLVQNVALRQHRNAFVNLALPFFAFTMPLPAEKSPGLDGNQYTLWDQLFIYETKEAALSGGIRLKSLLKQIRKKASCHPSGVSVASISIGPYMLYADYLHEGDKDVLNRSLWELAIEMISSSDTFDEDNSREGDDKATVVTLDDEHVDLTVIVEDIETGDEVELPPLRVQRFRR